MGALFGSEDFGDEIGKAVDDRWKLGEVGTGVDRAEHAKPGLDAIEFAQCGF